MSREKFSRHLRTVDDSLISCLLLQGLNITTILLKGSLKMSSEQTAEVVDLTNDEEESVDEQAATTTTPTGISDNDNSFSSSSASKKRKKQLETTIRQQAVRNVWVAIHRLEPGGYQCVGDYENGRSAGHLSHCPTTFDSTILGVFDSREKANRAAQKYADGYGFCDNEDEDEDSVVDFVGEGLFMSGEDSGDVNTFSQRIFVESHRVG